MAQERASPIKTAAASDWTKIVVLVLVMGIMQSLAGLFGGKEHVPVTQDQVTTIVEKIVEKTLPLILSAEPQTIITPTPDKISDEPLAAIEGPEKTPGTFMVLARTPPGATNTWRNKFPDGVKPAELELKDGRLMLWFQDPPAGEYDFRLRSQVVQPGLDPIEDAEHRTTVGRVPDPAPPEPSPTPMPPAPPAPEPTPQEKATAISYVYEKDDGPVPAPVLSALNRLNRETKVVATVFERDTKNGKQEVPEQYKHISEAAEKAGLPALVVLADDKVLRVVKSPTTEEAVMEAAR